ncbi:MAG TPA: outer membrane beta-barrel protein [Candidatus Polarisedimenticolaceae bacterium]|nr:outer membrane beta-barrel protein [Candidatus Polarisedimenticolaceae bacterium]
MTSLLLAVTVSASAYADVYAAYATDSPDDHELPGYLYNHTRLEEVNLNLGIVRIDASDERVRGALAFQYGTYVERNMAAEPQALQYVYEARVGVRAGEKRPVWIDAGIFTSHIGFESAVALDCWTLTRSLAAENSPYFEAGVKASLSPTEKLDLSFLLLNGWQRIERQEGNHTPSFGSQLAYKTTKESLFNWSTFVGTDTPDDARAWRVFNNFYWKLDRERYGLIAGLDVGAQEDIAGSGWDTWYTPQIVARAKAGPTWIYGRVEYYADPSHVIVAADAPEAFRTWAGTAGVDLPVTKYAVWRLDARQFHSDASKDFLVVTTGLAIRFGGDLK